MLPIHKRIYRALYESRSENEALKKLEDTTVARAFLWAQGKEKESPEMIKDFGLTSRIHKEVFRDTIASGRMTLKNLLDITCASAKGNTGKELTEFIREVNPTNLVKITYESALDIGMSDEEEEDDEEESDLESESEDDSDSSYGDE